MKSKDVNYFNLFIDSAKVAHKAALKLQEMLNGDPANFRTMAEEIHEIEHEGDTLYHTLYGHVNRSFITPIEREDILDIAKSIERTIDAIDEVSITIDLLLINSIRKTALELVELVVKSTEVMVECSVEFKTFKKSKKLAGLIVDLNHIEEDGDKIYQNATRTLFAEEPNPIEIIKWKEIFDKLENVLDTCENVGDNMEVVIVKNS